MLEASQEASPGVPTEPDGPPAPVRRGLTAIAALAFANRVVLVYFALHFFPYPISSLPYLEAVGAWHGKAVEALVVGVAKALGIEADPTPTGSSDTPYR